MRKRAIIVFCLAAFCVTPNISAQSLFNKIKKAAKETVEKKVNKEVKKVVPKDVSSKVSAVTKQTSNSGKQSAQSRNLERQTNAMVGKKNNKNIEDEAASVRLPKTHTALFAPLGYPIEAKYGIKKAKPVAPPKELSARTAWNDKLPDVQELDNQSLVEEYLQLDNYVAKGIVAANSDDAASWRYHTLVSGELRERCEALNDMVKYYNEAMEEYADDDTYNWVINSIHRNLAAVLEGRVYKTLIRSSITPLFTVKNYCVSDNTKAYFKAHGGYENATKGKLTAWDPQLSNKTVSTSSGQTGKVVSEAGGAGATIDLNGVTYLLHTKGNAGWAFVSKIATTTVVAGKDLVIPDYVTYDGKKYPVRKMRAELFKGTALKSVKLPSTLQEIPNSAFRETPITEITIPASVAIIQGSAFYGCKKLAKVVFEGSSAKQIHGCFQNCVSLTSIKFPRSVGLMSYDMFLGCTNLTSVALPENTTQIYKSMFKDCKSLKTIAIPRSVTKVEDYAFAGSGIVELDLSNVKEFGNGCFSGCKSLKSLKMNSSLKSVFVSDLYIETGLDQVPSMQVTLANDQYVLPSGLTFVNGK